MTRDLDRVFDALPSKPAQQIDRLVRGLADESDLWTPVEIRSAIERKVDLLAALTQRLIHGPQQDRNSVLKLLTGVYVDTRSGGGEIPGRILEALERSVSGDGAEMRLRTRKRVARLLHAAWKSNRARVDLSSEELAEHALPLVGAHDSNLRRVGLRLLIAYGADGYEEHFVQHIDSADPDVRRLACEGLVKYGDVSHLESVQRRLENLPDEPPVGSGCRAGKVLRALSEDPVAAFCPVLSSGVSDARRRRMFRETSRNETFAAHEVTGTGDLRELCGEHGYEWSTPGDIPWTKKEMRAGIQRIRQGVESCKAQRAQSAKSLDVDKIYLTLTVEPTGDVSKMVLEPERLRGTDFHGCLADERASWAFGGFQGSSQKLKAPFLLE